MWDECAPKALGVCAAEGVKIKARFFDLSERARIHRFASDSKPTSIRETRQSRAGSLRVCKAAMADWLSRSLTSQRCNAIQEIDDQLDTGLANTYRGLQIPVTHVR